MGIHRVDDKARFERAYHAIGRCAETFYLFVPIMTDWWGDSVI